MAGKIKQKPTTVPQPSVSKSEDSANKTAMSGQNSASSSESGKEKKEGAEEWKVQGISDIKASLVYVKNRLDYIKEEFYGEPPPSKAKLKKNAAGLQKTKEGDVPTLVNSGFREINIGEDGTARRSYGPRPNPNKNNIGELIEVSKEEAADEEMEVKNVKKKKTKKKRKKRAIGRLVRLQKKYAKKRSPGERHSEGSSSSDSFSESIITRLEYLGSTKDLLPGDYTYSDGYDVRKLESTGEYALISGDVVYGIGSPVIDSSEKGFRPLRLPIINVNDGFGKLKKELQNSRRAFDSLSLPLLRNEESFISVKKHLQNALRRSNLERGSSDDVGKSSSVVESKAKDETESAWLRNGALANSSRDSLGSTNYPNQPELGTSYRSDVNDVTSSLRVSAIRPTGSLPVLPKPKETETETDVTYFGQVNWPHRNVLAQQSHLAPMCSEPPPTTPESNLSDSELDKSHDIMSVTFRNQLFRTSERSTGQKIPYRSRFNMEPSRSDGYLHHQDFSDLRLDIVHRPLREKYQVK